MNSSGILTVGLIMTVFPASAQMIKEYIRLGDRLIAVESNGAKSLQRPMGILHPAVPIRGRLCSLTRISPARPIWGLRAF